MPLNIPQATKARNQAQARLDRAASAGRPIGTLAMELHSATDDLQAALWAAEVSAAAIGGQLVEAA